LELPVRFLLFLVCCALLGYGLFRPQSPPEFFVNSDKFMHVLAFAGLAFSARLAFVRVPGWLLWSLLLVLAPLAEWLQHRWQPVRQYSHEDMLANLAGVLLALLVWGLLGLLALGWRRWRRQG
jgi:VanZ family protein